MSLSGGIQAQESMACAATLADRLVFIVCYGEKIAK
jgi:hypothetical protein